MVEIQSWDDFLSSKGKHNPKQVFKEHCLNFPVLIDNPLYALMIKWHLFVFITEYKRDKIWSAKSTFLWINFENCNTAACKALINTALKL